MNKNITISFTIPLSEEGWLGSSLIFYQWIPENDNDAIVITDLHKLTDDRIKSWINITVFKLKIDVVLNEVESSLIYFIYGERDSPKEIHHGLRPEDNEFDILQSQYIELGNNVLKKAISVCN